MELLTRSLIPAANVLASLFSPGGRRARLSILIYHRVLAEPDPMRPFEVDAEIFRWHMSTVARHFSVIHLSHAIRLLESGSLPARSLCITFDDGYSDNAGIALPILEEFRLPATFFIATGYLNGGRMWNDTVIEASRRTTAGTVDLRSIGLGQIEIASDRDRYQLAIDVLKTIKYLPTKDREQAAEELGKMAGAGLPKDLMMTDADLERLVAAGMHLGGHTVRHPILTSVDASVAENEIAEGRSDLESRTSAEIELFAYPNGRRGKDYGPEHVDIVRRLGFCGAVSTDPGASGSDESRFELRRFTPWDRTPTRFLARMMLNCIGKAA